MIYLLSERISSVRPRLLFLGLFMLLPWSVQADDVLYEPDVRPILKAHCFHCHGEEGVKEANLDLRLAKFIKKGGVKRAINLGRFFDEGPDPDAYFNQS